GRLHRYLDLVLVRRVAEGGVGDRLHEPVHQAQPHVPALCRPGRPVHGHPAVGRTIHSGDDRLGCQRAHRTPPPSLPASRRPPAFIRDLRPCPAGRPGCRLGPMSGEVTTRSSRSVWAILRANLFTRFNAIIGTLLVVVLIFGPPQDGLFGLVILVNSAVGIVQELRAKRTLDALALLDESPVRVRRGGPRSRCRRSRWWRATWWSSVPARRHPSTANSSRRKGWRSTSHCWP